MCLAQNHDLHLVARNFRYSPKVKTILVWPDALSNIRFIPSGVIWIQTTQTDIPSKKEFLPRFRNRLLNNRISAGRLHCSR